MGKTITVIAIALVLSLMLIPTMTNLAHADVITYNLTDCTASAQVYVDQRVSGEKVATNSSILFNTTAYKVDIKLGKFGSPTGTGYMGVWTTADAPPSLANANFIFGSINVATLTTTSVCGVAPTVSFENMSQQYTFNENDIIGFLYDGGTAANFVRVFHRTYGSAGVSYNGSASQNVVYDTAWDAEGSPNAVNDLTMTVYSPETAGGSTGFCQNPANSALLRCVLEAQGGALGGNFANNPFDISQSSSNLLIQVGFLDGSDDNPATNGTGYLILAIALIIANVLLFIGTDGRAYQSASLFLPALISLVIVAGFTIGGLVDATVLIISIIVVVALSTPKIVSIVGGARGGGDTS